MLCQGDCRSHPASTRQTGTYHLHSATGHKSNRSPYILALGRALEGDATTWVVRATQTAARSYSEQGTTTVDDETTKRRARTVGGTWLLAEIVERRLLPAAAGEPVNEPAAIGASHIGRAIKISG